MADLDHQIHAHTNTKTDLNGSHKLAKTCTILRRDKLRCRLQDKWVEVMIHTAILLNSLVITKAIHHSKQPRQTRWTRVRSKPTTASILALLRAWDKELTKEERTKVMDNKEIMVIRNMDTVKDNLGTVQVMICMDNNNGKFQ